MLKEISLNGTRVRTVLLNLVLLVAFAAAWISDARPGLAVPALLIAFAVVVGAVALLYALAKRAQKLKMQPEDGANVDLVALQKKNVVFQTVRDLATEFGEHHGRLGEVLTLLTLHERAWSRQFALEYRQALFLRKVQFSFLYEHQRQLTPELAKWKILSRNEDVFNIEAGAFAIEHFHGHTNIRILDPSRVTVEGGVRGKSIDNLPPEIRHPVYN